MLIGHGVLYRVSTGEKTVLPYPDGPFRRLTGYDAPDGIFTGHCILTLADESGRYFVSQYRSVHEAKKLFVFDMDGFAWTEIEYDPDYALTDSLEAPPGDPDWIGRTVQMWWKNAVLYFIVNGPDSYDMLRYDPAADSLGPWNFSEDNAQSDPVAGDAAHTFSSPATTTPTPPPCAKRCPRSASVWRRNLIHWTTWTLHPRP